MTYTETIEERGGYRARIELDDYPTEPEHDSGCPVLRVDEGRVAFTGYGSESYRGDGISHTADDALQKFVTEFGQSDGLSTFERYIAIFHGGKTVRHSGHGWREPDYIAYTTERMAREVWGQSEPLLLDADMDEWIAYVEGDVYGVIIEEKTVTKTFVYDREENVVSDSVDDTWTEVESCWGHYGTKWAEQAARESLGHYADEAKTA